MLNSLRIPVRPLCELPPGPEQRQARQVMSGYFGRGGVRPTLCSLDEMDRCLGLSAQVRAGKSTWSGPAPKRSGDVGRAQGR